MDPFEPSEQPGTDADVTRVVTELLAGYLLTAVRGTWPGTDSLTVAEGGRGALPPGSAGWSSPRPR